MSALPPDARARLSRFRRIESRRVRLVRPSPYVARVLSSVVAVLRRAAP